MEKRDATETLETFSRMSVAFARVYLGCGGPTSRLEEKLEDAAAALGIQADIFATPTGVFISCYSTVAGKLVSEIGRIRQQTVNLSQLEWAELLLRDLGHKRLTPREALAILEHPETVERRDYPEAVRVFCAFLAGAVASFGRFLSLEGALVSGALSMGVFLLSGLLARRWKFTGVFCDFIGCLLALVFSGLLSAPLGVPPEVLVIGALTYLVPGLTLTTAISELADHNFVSGTAKLMKGVLTLLAMGIAYMIVRDAGGERFFLNELSQTIAIESLNSFERFLLTGTQVLLVASFAVIFYVPKRAILWATASGMLSLVIFKFVQSPDSFVLAPFLASLSVGTASLILGRHFKLPSQIYSVPGILSLVPGMLALSSFRSFAAGSQEAVLEAGFRVALIASAIVFGLLSARIPFIIFRPRREFDEIV